MNLKMKTKKAFTLVELILVMAILSILAAMLIPNVSGLIKRANDTVNRTNSRNLYTSVVMAMIDYNHGLVTNVDNPIRNNAQFMAEAPAVHDFYGNIPDDSTELSWYLDSGNLLFTSYNRSIFALTEADYSSYLPIPGAEPSDPDPGSPDPTSPVTDPSESEPGETDPTEPSQPTEPDPSSTEPSSPVTEPSETTEPPSSIITYSSSSLISAEYSKTGKKKWEIKCVVRITFSDNSTYDFNDTITHTAGNNSDTEPVFSKHFDGTYDGIQCDFTLTIRPN